MTYLIWYYSGEKLESTYIDSSSKGEAINKFLEDNIFIEKEDIKDISVLNNTVDEYWNCNFI